MTKNENAPGVVAGGAETNAASVHPHYRGTPLSTSRPLDVVLARLSGVCPRGDHYTAHCPGPGHAHGDKRPSLSIGEGRDGRALLKCFAGCTAESIARAIGLTLADLMPPRDGGAATTAYPPRQTRATMQHPPPPPAGGEPALTLNEYATAKRLPLRFLESLGLATDTSQGRARVRIPYRHPDGTDAAIRYRVSMTGDPRFLWKPGSKSLLYGLDRLDAARASGYVVIVEGESDCHTLWHHGIPAVGLPGAASWNESRDARHLDGIGAIHVVCEPDTGGDAVRRWLATSSIRDRARLLDLSAATGHKDPSGLHLADPDAFPAAWKAAMEAAPPFTGFAPQHDSDSQEPPADADPALWAAGVYASRMDNVRPEPITWIWTHYIPAGAITVVEGDGGRGKSLFTLDIAARVTRGETMPDNTPSDLDGPAGVILVGLEDGKSTTVRPRLDAAGADPARVYVWEGLRDAYGGTRPASLAPEDLPRLETLIRETGAKMVIVDAFTAVLPERIDSHKDQSIRAVMMPLKQLAERTGAAMLLIRHWTKGVAVRASDRGVGSVGIGNTARSRLAVGDDPSNPEARAVGQTKMNLVPPDTPTYGFTVAVADNGYPRIQWTGRAACSANDIAMSGDQDAEARTAKQDAGTFLQEYLSEGPKPAREVEQAARKIDPGSASKIDPGVGCVTGLVSCGF